MLAIDRETTPRHRGFSPPAGAECWGDAAVVRAQRVLFAARAWISEQEGLATQGSALALFHAHALPPDRREALVRCFERVLLHAPAEAIPALAASLRASELRVVDRLPLFAAPAAQVRAAVHAMDRFRPLPAGWMLAEVGSDESEATIRAIQELQTASGLAPLPGWYLRGGEGRALSLVLRDAGGDVLGTTTLSAMRPADVDAAAWRQLGLLGDPPAWGRPAAPPSWTGMPLATCLREDVRARGLSPALLGAALRAGYERLGIRYFYAIVENGDEIATRMIVRCGLSPHLAEGFLFAEPLPAL